MADDGNVLYVRGNGNKDGGTDTDDVWDDTVLIKAYDKAVNMAKEEVAKRIGVELQSSAPKSKSQRHKQSCTTHKQQKKWCVGSPCRAVYSEDGEIYEAIITKIYENSGTCIVKFVGYDNTEKVELWSLLESEGLQSQIAQQKDALMERCDEESMDQSETGCSNTSKVNDTVGEKMEFEFDAMESSTDFGTKRVNGIAGEKMRLESSKRTSNIDSNIKKVNGVAGEKMKFESEAGASTNFIDSGPSFNSFLNMMPPAPPLPPQLMAKLPENDADALSSMLMSWYISGFHTGYYHGLKHARDNHLKRKNC